MALIVEDGTGLANSESYASVAFYRDYFTKRNISITSSDEVIESNLRLGTEYIDSINGQRFKGTKSTLAQALQWPRVGVWVDGYELPVDEIPVEIQRACCEFAYAAVSNTLLPNLTQGVKREKIDVIEIEYDEFSSRLPKFSKAGSLLSKYLTGGANQCQVTRV